jgi:1,4-dihydroxy-2-naphthoate octaprenyltransferase
VGAVSILAAWYYTGGKKPYGYLGLGEVMVFVFFGLVAVLGTQYVQAEELTWGGLAAAVGVGALACAILVTNNLRDIPTDTVSGKRTLAVKLGDSRTRTLYVVLVVGALLSIGAVAALTTPAALLGVLGYIWLNQAIEVVAKRRAVGPALIPVLQLTGIGELVCAVGLFTGLLIGR